MDQSSKVPAAEAIVRLRGFRQLGQDTLRELGGICRLRSFSAGEVIAHDGERCEFIGCVNTGFLRMQKTLADGRQQIVGLLVEGDMFGQAFEAPQHFAIEAATDAEVWAFRRAPFEALLLRAPDLERAVMLNILNELDRARDWMVIVSGQKVTAKLAGFLLVMCSTFAQVDHILRRGCDGECFEIAIPISRTDLANLLGTRPESISRAFHKLQARGALGILQPDLIRVHDVAALAEEAGDDGLGAAAGLSNLVRSARRA
jgi:CRP/FNR family transcriptional regulator